MKRKIILLGLLLVSTIGFGQWANDPATGGTTQQNTQSYVKMRDHLIFNSQNAVINWGNGSGDLYLRSLSLQGDINSYRDRIKIKYNGWTTFWGDLNNNAYDPADQLHVYPSSGATGITITNPSGVTRSAITLENTSSPRKYSIGTTGSSDAIGASKFVIKDVTGNADRFTINTSGYTGICVTTPTAYLHVKNAVNNNDIPTLLVENVSTGIYQNIRAQVNKVNKAENKGFVIENTMSNPGEVVKIYGDGKTMIGLSTSTAEVPASMVHIKSAIPRESFRIYNTTQTDKYLSLWHAGDGGSAVDPIGSGTLFLGYDQSTAVRIGGNYGNGSNPYSKLGIGVPSSSNIDAFFHIQTPDIAWHGILLDHRSTAAVTAQEIRVKNNDAKALLVSNYVGVPYEGFKVYGTGRTVIGNASPSNVSAGPNVQLGVYQNSPIGIGQCVELRSNTTNAINTLLICDRDDEYAIQVNKFTNPGYIANFRVMGSGKTLIGTQSVVGSHTDAMLQVAGKIATKSLYVLNPSTWMDKVFESDYQKGTLSEVEQFILKNKHLPGINSEKDILENGYDVNEMDAKLLEQIEKLYLYVIDQQKEIEQLKQAVKNK